VIRDQAYIVLSILLLIVLSCTLIVQLLRIIFTYQLTQDEYLFLGVSGWLVPASLLSLAWFALGFEYTLALIFILTIIISLHPRLKPDPQPASSKLTLSLLTILCVSIALRLVFVSRAILPPYFDSAQHYLLVKQLVEQNTTDSLRYYHLGFHTLAAFIASTLHANIAQTMLILGQIILAVMPLSLYSIIKHETNSTAAGIFTILLAAYGWYMPAHAVNWGKYPALMSVGLIPFVLSVAYLFSRQVTVTFATHPRSEAKWDKVTVTSVALLAIGAAITVFAHSRALVILGIAFLAWLISTWWQRLSHRAQSIILIATLVVLVAEIFLIQKQTILTLVFDPYLHKGIWITALVLILSTFAHREYPQIAFACVVSICFLLMSLFIPVNFIPGYIDLTLLDRPYVEMILFLPLSLLGGLGLAGLGITVDHKYFKLHFFNIFAIGIVLINTVIVYDWRPSPCCVIAGNDDITALDWMDDNIPLDARIGISSTQLKVLVSNSFEGTVGSDAGVWITPLIGRVTVALSNLTAFDQQNTQDMLCQKNIDYLYIGELGQTFNDAQLQSKPEWYKAILSMPRVRVYEVVGCQSPSP